MRLSTDLSFFVDLIPISKSYKNIILKDWTSYSKTFVPPVSHLKTQT